VTLARLRMCPLGWLGVASLCLGTLWAVPAKDRRKAEKPKADLSLYGNLDLDNYDLTLDNYGEMLDLSNYEELYEYGDFVPKIEVGTLAPRPRNPQTLSELDETTAGTPKLQPGTPKLQPGTPKLQPETPKLQPPSGAGPAPPAPIPGQGLPGCQLCLCLGSSVYCDDAGLERIPALPSGTEYLYARFNRIGAIRAADFSGLEKLKRIDLSSNSIRWADADAFRLLPRLQELLLAQNRLTALPELPRSIVRLDARLNRIPSAGLRPEAFLDLKQLQFLHLSDNQLDFIPVPLPQSLRSLHLQNNNIRTMHEDAFCDSQEQGQVRRALEDIRLDGNPINLSLFASAFSCLPRLPTGRFS
ncbi:OPT protein, partial [Picathartes gymnocephalus]|nr:OPT protein [Picathartes gymnocephalus]